MKRKLQIMVTASAASVLAFSALAQDTPKLQTNRADYARDGVNYPRDGQSHARRANQLNSAAKASDIIGMTVNNYQDEKLGKVDDLAVDVESGRIVQVILSTGGFIGIGDTLSAVPPGALHHDAAKKVLHLDANKEKLRGAPKFETSKWAEGCDSNQLSQVYGYYGEEPSFTFIHKGNAVLNGPRDTDDQVIRDGQRNNPDRQRDNPARVRNNTDGVRNTQDSPNTAATRNADGTWGNDRNTNESQYLIPVSRLAHLQRASKLMGTSVKNLQDEKLGKVENLLLDLSAGRIVAVIVSSGGFLGLGDELSAVPPTALRFNTERDILQLDATKETLSRAPHFKANQWPEVGNPVYADRVYRAYQVEPYFTTNATAEPDNRRTVRDRNDRGLTATDETTQPDNTARNARDRNDRTLTPLDQGNSQADVDTTAQIRKEIIAGKNMSTNARNVKIITNNGRVTLRGPVNSAEEKRMIGEIANRIARSENVDNQLEVKITTTNIN